VSGHYKLSTCSSFRLAFVCFIAGSARFFFFIFAVFYNVFTLYIGRRIYFTTSNFRALNTRGLVRVVHFYVAFYRSWTLIIIAQEPIIPPCVNPWYHSYLIFSHFHRCWMLLISTRRRELRYHLSSIIYNIMIIATLKPLVLHILTHSRPAVVRQELSWKYNFQVYSWISQGYAVCEHKKYCFLIQGIYHLLFKIKKNR